MSLIDLATFKDNSTMPPEDVDALEVQYPGFVARRIAKRESRMNDRLVNRYAVPFSSASPPDTAVDWVVAQVTLDCYMRRGWNPTSAQDLLVKEQSDKAEAQILEAANSDTGLFNLPIRQSSAGTTGVSKGGPFGYSETSPYVAFDRQADDARNEDFVRRGT